MKKSYIFLALLLIPFVSSQVQQFGGGQSQTSQILNILTGSASGTNVSSVTSSTNCITVNPITNDVILTFNQSCSGTGNSSWNEAYANTLYAGINNVVNSIVNDPLDNYLVFSPNQGSVFAYLDEPTLNGTINNLISHNNTNTFNGTYNNLLGQTCPIGQIVNGTLTNGTIKCQAVMTFLNNTNIAYLNNTQTFTGTNSFKNITTANITSSGWIDGVNFILRNAGASFFPATSYQVTTQDVGSGLLTLPVISMIGGAGILAGAIRNGLWILPQDNTQTSQILLSKNANADDVWLFENNNNTGELQVSRFNPFTTAKQPSHINLTNNNVTSNHQSYDTTGAINLDTTYTNTFQRPILVSMSVEITKTDDFATAIVTTYVNGTECSGKFGHDDQTAKGTSYQESLFGQVHCIIQPNLKYSFNTTIGGSGSVTKAKVQTTVI